MPAGVTVMPAHFPCGEAKRGRSLGSNLGGVRRSPLPKQTHSGLLQDGLCLGFLRRHHRSLAATAAPEAELQKRGENAEAQLPHKRHLPPKSHTDRLRFEAGGAARPPRLIADFFIIGGGILSTPQEAN